MIKKLLEELEKNENFIKLKSKHPNLFFCTAFISNNLETKTSKTQLDFFLPSENKIVSFEHPFDNFKKYDDEIYEIKEQSAEIKIDKSHLEKCVKKSIENNKCSLIPTQIIAILKNDEWNMTAINNSLGIVKIKYNAKTGEEKYFSKGSFMEFVKIDHNNK